jgi:hypothetical protein
MLGVGPLALSGSSPAKNHHAAATATKTNPDFSLVPNPAAAPAARKSGTPVRVEPALL